MNCDLHSINGYLTCTNGPDGKGCGRRFKDWGKQPKQYPCPLLRPAKKQPPKPLTLDDEIQQAIDNGQATVSRETIDARLSVCRACDQFNGDKCRLLCPTCTTARCWFWVLVGAQAAAKCDHQTCPKTLWPT